jgi:hypothetical protein
MTQPDDMTTAAIEAARSLVTTMLTGETELALVTLVDLDFDVMLHTCLALGSMVAVGLEVLATQLGGSNALDSWQASILQILAEPQD